MGSRATTHGETVMYGVTKRQLEARAGDGNPIRVGFVGAGRMGTGAICQIRLMSGMKTSVIADLDAERAPPAFALSGRCREDIVFRCRACMVRSLALRRSFGCSARRARAASSTAAASSITRAP